MVLLLVLFSTILIVSGQKNCDKLGTLVYEELGCKPVYADPKECPTHYDCEKYELSQKYCRYQGQRYNPGKYIDAALLSKSCNAGCFCASKENAVSSINCAILDCPEYLRSPLNDGCYYKYELGKCCANIDEVICPPYNGLAICNVDGEIYTEGQRFEPLGTCMKCVCQKGFKGRYEAPFCMRRNCGFEIKHADKLQKNCAPVYYVRGGGAVCCPDNFICPSESDEIMQRPTSSKQTGSCKFGTKLIKANERFVRSLHQWGRTRTIECVCVVPPFLTCTAPY